MPPATLSLGQRRLVTLAAVLAARPAVVVLDEPTGGLDWGSRQDLMDRVTAFNAGGGTVILITHDVRLIAEYASPGGHPALWPGPVRRPAGRAVRRPRVRCPRPG